MTIIDNKKDDLEQVIEKAKLLLVSVPVVADNTIICLHPFTNSFVAPYQDKEKGMYFLNLLVPEDYEKWKIKWFNIFDNCTSVDDIFRFCDKNWRLTLLKLCKEYLSKESFATWLAESWILSECANTDKNVSLKTAIEWFKEADKNYLMDSTELDYFENLPDMVTIYRGVCIGHNPNGLSYTDNKDKAVWFAERFNTTEPKLLKAVVPKEYCLCYLNRRDEQEIVLDVFKAKKYIHEISIY